MFSRSFLRLQAGKFPRWRATIASSASQPRRHFFPPASSVPVARGGTHPLVSLRRHAKQRSRLLDDRAATSGRHPRGLSATNSIKREV
jgi:hypothetical protein